MNTNESLLDVYIYENEQLLETLETTLLEGEKQKMLTPPQINEIFRIMHTIKGSSSMMEFDKLAKVTHKLEDLFAQIREKGARGSDWDKLFDMVLAGTDFIKGELVKVKNGATPDGEALDLVKQTEEYLEILKSRKSKPENAQGDVPAGGASEQNSGESDDELEMLYPIYKIKILFEDDCKMENIRALGAANSISKFCFKFAHVPSGLEGEEACEQIVKDGFIMYAQSGENPDNLKKLMNEVMFVKSYTMVTLEADNDELPVSIRRAADLAPAPAASSQTGTAAPVAAAAPVQTDLSAKQNFISVNVNKLDSLLDLVGELVTTESMVTENPDLAGLTLNNFENAAQQLRNLTTELQNIVMSIRLLPVATTFHKMQRMVRDMSKKISKSIELAIIGEETEVDKNIIDNLSDPLMHLIRNSVDHGIESPEDRERMGKTRTGKITLEARNMGSDVLILISDDGKGLDRNLLIRKATEKGLINKAESEISDREAFSYIFLPGFSTKEQVTEFSGRGVGMDVVRKNIEKIGGSVSIESTLGHGTTTTIRIPLTLAIINGMRVNVSGQNYIIPILSIRQSFKPKAGDIFLDPDGNEMIMIRSECYSVFRLTTIFDLPESENKDEGLLMILEADEKRFCIYIDELVGEQSVVVKPLPPYIQKIVPNLNGIGGCTILGDGTISLILDVNSLLASPDRV